MYLVVSFGPGFRSLLSRQARASAARRVAVVVVVLWVAAGLILGTILAVLTDWLVELPVPRPRPGELLYATTFDAFNEEWDLFPGRDSAQISAVGDVDGGASNSELVIRHGSGALDEVIWSVLDRKFNDFDLRVTAHLVEGPLDQNQYGVIFRYRDENNFYIFRISADGYYSLSKIEGGVEEKISDWGTTEAIRRGVAPNRIRIVGEGDAFRFYVNDIWLPLCLKGENETSMWAGAEGPGVCLTDEPTMVFRDSTFTQGRIALAAGTFDGSEVAVAFDDLVIVGPDTVTSQQAPEE